MYFFNTLFRNYFINKYESLFFPCRKNTIQLTLPITLDIDEEQGEINDDTNNILSRNLLFWMIQNLLSIYILDI